METFIATEKISETETFSKKEAIRETEAIREQYRRLDQCLAALSYELSSKKEFETVIFRPTMEKKHQLEQRLKELRAEVTGLSVPAPQFGVVKGHLEDFLDGLEQKLHTMYTNPCEALGTILWREDALNRDHRSKEERDAVLHASLAQISDVWNAVCEWIDTVPAATLQSTRAFLLSGAEEMRNHSREETACLLESYAEALAEKCLEAGTAKEVEADETRRIPMEKEAYRKLLWNNLGVKLDALLEWGSSEMEKTRNDCFARAAVLAKEKNEPVPETMEAVNELLFRYAGPCDSAEEMFARAAGYLKRTRELAHRIVPLPEDEVCDLMPTPWKLRESFPWGGYSDGDIEERPIRGGMFLNQYNFKAVTDGWIKMNCLHEAYPGHHVQYVRTITDPIPETMKIGAKSIAIMEGMCHRTERVYEDIYAEDPFFPLFVSYRRHHTAVRIQADLMLYYYGCTIAEVTKLYQRELGFDEKTARGQVRAQENMPGYFTAYYYGMKTICDWEKEFGYEKDDYTRLLFSLSNVSLETFRSVLELGEEERKDFFHGFRSLYMSAEESLKD